ncbi:MAG: AbrB/MazE/SpoVT family DNA-binding domain-containing protein [Acidobacteria bacterium]|nr:AbrB/MazE/SpoVT family DNA-binding domain-containing protein [Acidobacteriota bacterium]
MAKASSKIARVFRTGSSQAVRLPREFRFDTGIVLIRREGGSVILEPVREWPANYVESFAGIPEDFERPPQGNARMTRPCAAARRVLFFSRARLVRAPSPRAAAGCSARAHGSPQ